MKKINRVLLINPYVTDFKLYDEWMKPLGLYYLSARLKERGVQVDYINCLDRMDPELPHKYQKLNQYGTGDFYREQIEKPLMFEQVPRTYKRYGIPIDRFIYKLKSVSTPDAILVTSLMTYWYPGVFFTIEILKQYFPNTPIILGGIYASLCYDHAIQYSQADYVLSSLNQRDSIRDLFQILDLKDAAPLQTNAYPLFDYTLEEQSFLPLLLQQHCPFRCKYCAANQLASTNIQHNIDLLYPLIEDFHHRNVHNVCFYDDALLHQPEKQLFPLLTYINTKGYKFQFHTPNGLHARYIDKSMANTLFKSGFQTIRIGYETGDPDLQTKTGNKVDDTHIQKAVDHLKMAGFSKSQIGVYIMAGMPGYSFDQFYNDVLFLKSLSIRIMPVFYSPVPFTDTYDRLMVQFPLIQQEPLAHNDSFFILYQREDEYLSFQQIKQSIVQWNKL